MASQPFTAKNATLLIMGMYANHILPKLVHYTCGQRPHMRQRQKIVPLAEGRVLEIGIGSGLNIPFYDRTKVEHLWGLDPSAEMWSIAQGNAQEHHLDAEFLQSGAECIPLDDNSADTVVMTYTMCTLPDVETSMQEIRRVLKPAGRLMFCEHGRAPDSSVERWQNRLNPLWTRLSGGCKLNLPVPELLESSGFRISDMHTMYLPGWRVGSFNYWGAAS